MFSTLDEVKTKPNKPGDDENLDHLFCTCNEEVSLCGLDISDFPHNNEDVPPEDDLCLVCDDLCMIPCPKCGE